MELYRAVVEDNQDPDKLGRVRVRIWELHTPSNEYSTEKFNFVKTSDLPWAEVMGGTEFGLIGGTGLTSVLRQGTWVWIVLERDNPNKPVVVGTIKGNVTTKTTYTSGVGFNDPAGVHPQVLNHSDLSSLQDSKYGTLAVLVTDSGHTIELDDTSGDERIKVKHKSGTYVEIDSLGNVTWDIVGNLSYTVSGSLSYQVAGTTTINSSGDYSVTAPRIDLNP